MKKLIKLLVLVLFLIQGTIIHAETPAFDLQKAMEDGFWKTFSDPAEFEASEIFQLMGYSASEISQIGKITPRPAKINVEISKGEAAESFNNIKVVCHSVFYYNMTIERVTFEFPQCRVSLEELKAGRLRFLAGDCIKIKTEVSQQDILKVFDLFAKAKSLSGLKMKLQKDHAILRGRIKKGFLIAEFNLKGNTLLVDAKTVLFRCERLLLNGSPMPRNTIAGIFAQINPVFDASKTWLNLNVASINILPGFIETIATIDRKKG